MADHDHIRLFVERGRSGRPVFEEVAARKEDDCWRLLATPCLTLGIAAGDRLMVRDDGTFEVVERGMNVAVQVEAPAGAEQAVLALKGAVEELGGRLDGHVVTGESGASLTVFTIPVRAGFGLIEATMSSFTDRMPDGGWYYANIYNPIDETTPLNWWK